jgi:hypothetical protein
MKAILLLVFFIGFSLSSQSQEKNKWAPDFVVVQGAGSIGLVSAGFGYNLIKSKARFSAHYGIVPQSHSGILNVVSTKLYFRPARFTIWNRVRMNPFDIGIMGSYHFGGRLEEEKPEGVRPRGYYWSHPAFRTHLGMESSVTYEFRKGKSLHSATGYIEFNTNEQYFISFVKNIKTISLWDIVTVGTGVRVYF